MRLMRQHELWARYCASNPDFAKEDARITLTGRGLKKLFDQTYEMAHKEGVANGKAMERKKQASSNPFGNFFR